jgi:hypothetical protein
MQLAFLARYGNQSVFDLLGRNPITDPLSQRETALFQAALTEHLRDEYPDHSSSTTDGESYDG